MLRFTENRRSSGLSTTTNPRTSLSTHGLVEATQAQAIAGTITGRFMSPLRVEQRLNAGISFAQIVSGVVRERLTAARTYYVRTTGSDSNTGLADTAGGAFLTIQKAIDTANQTIDRNSFVITIQVSTGTYTGAVSVGQGIGNGSLTIQGDTTTPSNVVISTTSASCFTFTGSGQVTLAGFKLQTTSSGDCIISQAGSVVLAGAMNYGACAGVHQDAAANSVIYNYANYTISGGAVAHWHASAEGAQITAAGLTITLTGTPAFSAFFAGAAHGEIVCSSNTFSGSATGPRFLVHKNGTIDTSSGSTTYLPGNSVGVIATGGLYYGSTILQDNLTAYLVANLPTASIVGAGARALVTDANATTFASTVAGSGANIVPVYSDGTNWKIG